MTSQDKMRAAANRLHHLSMRYAGAMQELVSGKPVGLIPSGAPGFKEARDFIDLILLTRAEINGITKILYEAGLVSTDHLNEVYAEEYDWLTNEKAIQLGVGVNDAGLVFHNDAKPK